MQSDELVAMDKEVVETGFVTALENVDWVIKDMSVQQPRLFVNLIQRAAYSLGTGLTRTIQKFYGDIGDQGGLTFWNQIKTSTPATNEAAAYDSCKPMQARMTGHGIARQTYTGWETALRTPDICINDIKWTTEFKQQVTLIFKHLAEISMQTWENAGREGYIYFGRKLVCSEGSPDSAEFTYNPFSSTQITLSSAIPIGTLNWQWLEWHHQYLTLQNRGSASGNMSGAPIWPLIVDPADMSRMIRNDADLREDFRNSSKSDILIENYMALKTVKDMFALNYDMLTPRFNEISNDGTTRTLERVPPFEMIPVLIGMRPKISTAYMNAQYGLAHIYLKDTFSFEVPPTVASAGGGTEFGVIPGLMGKFEWMNIQTPDDNRYREKGHYDARFQAFLKPGDYSEEGITVLYSRCVNVPARVCLDIVGTTVTAIAGTSAAVKVGDEATYNQVDVTLAELLPCQKSATVTVTYGAEYGTSATASIASDADAPTYRLTFQSNADWAAVLASAYKVICA